MVKIYTTYEDINDATSYYVDILKASIERLGYDVSHVYNANEVSSEDCVIVITINGVNEVWKKHPKKIITWWQGIVPEESYLRNTNRSWLNKRMRFYILRYLERKALLRTNFHLFVSENMKEHYERVYHTKITDYYVMPCFNQCIQETAFNNEKYKTPTFLYAGNLEAWQCFEKTVLLYSKIKDRIPNASFTVFTKDKDTAQNILDKYNVDAQTKYVPYTQFAEETLKYKYGFILRDDIEVNRVATPTKMNSYLSCGIIPVFSDVVGYYKTYMSDLKYSVSVDANSHAGIDKLYEIESKTINAADVLEEYSKVFETCYNREKYIGEISNRIKDIIK